MSRIEVYTDGSCLKNPNGPSGWAFIINDSSKMILCSGGERSSTNNRMEITAVIEALKFCDSNKKYIICTDSEYVIKCATGVWAQKANNDLWVLLSKEMARINLEWKWVKAHSGIALNEKVDMLAKSEAKKF